MSSLLTCKTYPCDTVVIQKITLIEKKPIPTKIINVEANEINCIRSKIKPSERSVRIVTIDTNIENDNDLKSIDSDDNENVVVLDVNKLENANEKDENANVSIDYTKFKNIAIPSDCKHDLTYDGATIYRVDF